MTDKQNNFIWYELMTVETEAAEAFYKVVVGWNTEKYPGMDDYTVLKVGDRGIGGIMSVPDSDMKPGWFGYIHTPDVDAKVSDIKAAGGQIHRPGWDLPGVGRLAFVADPHGAMFYLLAPQGEEQPPLSMETPGNIGWRELYAGDLNEDFAFYSKQFGWTETERMDMGEMGPYLLYADGGTTAVGGVMKRPPNVPAACWIFYFVVGNIDEAVERVKSNGGSITLEPMEVPGGAWVIMATDPQGAAFALVGSRTA